MVEADESPRQACIREVKEELGLEIMPNALLSVGYLEAGSRGGDMLRFLFWGGVLPPPAIRQIRLPVDELSEYRFVSLAESATFLTPSLAAQVCQAASNVSLAGSIYWEES